jgi:glucose-6-phosphate isomerase
LVVPSPSLLRCGLPRKRRSRKESAVRTDKPSNSSAPSSVRWVDTSSNTRIAPRLRDLNRTTNLVRVVSKTETSKTTEVTIVVAEAANVEVAIEINKTLSISSSKSFRLLLRLLSSLFLRLMLQI